MTKQHGTHDVEVTNNARAIRWSDEDKEKIIFTNYIVNQLHNGRKSVCQCRVVSCKACNFTVFCQKKMSQKRQKEGDTWMDWYLRSSMYYITLTLHNPINLLNVVSTNSFSWASNLYLLLHGVQTSWDCWNLPNKQFQSKSTCFFSFLSGVNK